MVVYDVNLDSEDDISISIYIGMDENIAEDESLTRQNIQ